MQALCSELCRVVESRAHRGEAARLLTLGKVQHILSLPTDASGAAVADLVAQRLVSQNRAAFVTAGEGLRVRAQPSSLPICSRLTYC